MTTEVARAINAVGEPLEVRPDDPIIRYIHERISWANSVGRHMTLRYGGEGHPIGIIFNGRRVLLASRNWVYVDAILVDFDYYFDAIDAPVIDGMPTADYSRPGWHTVKGVSRPYYFTSFAEGWGESTIYLEHLRPQPGETVLDLGGYCGLSSMTFADAVGPTGRVFSFEPDPDNFASFQKNLAAYPYPNITLVNKAIWGIPKSLFFSCEGNMGSMVVDIAGGNRDRLVEVEGTNLDSIARDFDLPKVDIVKMDIEGSEYEALDASHDFIEKNRARWMIEVHDEAPGKRANFERVRRIFERHQYATYQIPRGNNWFPLICALPY